MSSTANGAARRLEARVGRRFVAALREFVEWERWRGRGLARRVAFTNAHGMSWHAIGTALHAFLAADVGDLAAEHGVEIAERILSRAELRGSFAPEVEGTIDLRLETPDGYVLIDHKSFPGRREHWHERAVEYAPQLFIYAKAVTMAGGKVLTMLIHFTVGGESCAVGDG